MKKFLAIALTAAMLLSLALVGVSAAEVYDGTSVSASLSGTGTEADPYLIANGADLAFFAANPVDGACYKLTADIVWASAPEATNWTPVAFNGTFDGDGHSISGLYIKGAETAALFASATGTIKNLTIQDSYFEGTKYVSAFVGQLVASKDEAAKPSLAIDNCVSYANICSTKKNSLIGSMIGDVYGIARKTDKNPDFTYLTLSITNCVNYGTVSTTNTGTVYIGGIAGRVFATSAVIDSCANFGDVVSGGAISGGIVGQSGIGEYGKEGDNPGCSNAISNCLNAGNASAKRICGGIIGRSYPGSSVTNCVNLGNTTITVVDAENTGYQKQFGPITGHGADVVGEEYTNCGVITNCYSSADAVMSNSNDAAATPYYESAATVKTAAELNSADMVTALGDAWALDNGKLTLKILVVEEETPEETTVAPEETTAAPAESTEAPSDTTEPGASTPTGDSAIIFAVIAVLSVLGVAVVAKKREN